jgi:hypothetical protein
LNETGGSGDTQNMPRPPLTLLAPLPFALIVGVGVAPRALAAEPAGRVVVVVDSSAGLGLDGEAVRRAISDELRAPVVAPSDEEAGGAASMLVVSIDKGTIRMTLRSSRSAAATRAIPASPDRSVRLRDIAWLAGNLLRDQVSPIVGLPPAAASRTASATAPPPLAPGPKQEPTAAPAARDGRGEAALGPPVDALAARGSDLPGAPRRAWLVTALAGPLVGPAGGGQVYVASAYELELRRRAAAHGLVVGMDLLAGHAWGIITVHPFGVGGFVGKEWRGSRWFGDAAGGAGIEIVQANSLGTFNCTSPCVLSSSPSLAPYPFVRVTSTLGVAVTPRFDFVVRMAVQLSSYGLELSTAGVTAGLRLRLL